LAAAPGDASVGLLTRLARELGHLPLARDQAVTAAMQMGGIRISVISGLGGAVSFAISMASGMVRAVSQPMSFGMYSLSAPTTMTRPVCCRPASPQYHMKKGWAGWYALPVRYAWM